MDWGGGRGDDGFFCVAFDCAVGGCVIITEEGAEKAVHCRFELFGCYFPVYE